MKYFLIRFFQVLFICASPVAISAQQPELYVQSGHSSAINSVAISRDGRTAASCDDSQIKLWDIASRRLSCER
jgi:WD40 repeat protein